MRRRYIDPEIVRNEDLAACSMACELFFILLWMEADREGRFLWSARHLSWLLYPLRAEVTLELIEGWLDELLEHGLIDRYVVGKYTYGHVAGFSKLQTLHPREAQSSYPPPPDIAKESPQQARLKRSRRGQRHDGVLPKAVPLPALEGVLAAQGRHFPTLDESFPANVEIGGVEIGSNRALRAVPAQPLYKRSVSEDSEKKDEEKKDSEKKDMSTNSTFVPAFALTAPPPGVRAPRYKSEDINRVFEHWKRLWKKRDAVHLSDQRRRKILKALEMYGVDHVKDALDGYAANAFHQGDNDRNEIYDEICLHLRDPEHIEKGITLAITTRLPKLNSEDRRVRDMMAKFEAEAAAAGDD